MTKLLDNRGQGRVGDALREGTAKGARLAILSRVFSVHGFSALEDSLGEVEQLRFLLPSDDGIVPSDGKTEFRAGAISSDAGDRHAGEQYESVLSQVLSTAQ